MPGEARNPRVELRIGEASSAAEVDGRDLARRAAAEMRDPVVVSNGQKSPPEAGRSGAARLSCLAVPAGCPSPAVLASASFGQKTGF
jgi:hypothetical protein